MIQTMENFLRSYVGRRPAGWSQHLALAEFAANNAVSVAIGYTPFFLNFGDHPIVLLILLHGRDVSSHVEAVQTMVDRMKTALEEAHANLSVAANQAKTHANALQREEKYAVGNEVGLATRHLCINEHLLVKLRRRWIGSFSIAKVISLVAYRLNLPPNWRIHPIFYVFSLKRYYWSEEFERVERPPSPIMVNDEEEFEVEAILRHKGSGARRLYQVLWKGYPITEASWEPKSHLCNAPQILEEYLCRIIAKTSVRRRQQNRGSQRTTYWSS